MGTKMTQGLHFLLRFARVVFETEYYFEGNNIIYSNPNNEAKRKLHCT